MAFYGAGVGAVLVAALNSTVSAVPAGLQSVAEKVLVPASEWLINPVMPIIFWMAAMDAGRRTGGWATVLGGLAHVVMGNAVPGIVLGILVGKGVDDGGWNRVTRTLAVAVVLLFTLSAFFRGIDVQLLQDMDVTVPSWLIDLHATLGSEVEK